MVPKLTSPSCKTWLHKCPTGPVRRLWSCSHLTDASLSPLTVGKLGCLQVAALSTLNRGLFFPWDYKETSLVELIWDSVHLSSTAGGQCWVCQWWCSCFHTMIQHLQESSQTRRCGLWALPAHRQGEGLQDWCCSLHSSLGPAQDQAGENHRGRRMSTGLSDCSIQLTGYRSEPGNIA